MYTQFEINAEHRPSFAIEFGQGMVHRRDLYYKTIKRHRKMEGPDYCIKQIFFKTQCEEVHNLKK